MKKVDYITVSRPYGVVILDSCPANFLNFSLLITL